MAIVVKQFHHASLAVTRIEHAKHFYESVLGLEEIARPAFNFAGAWYDLGDGRQLHLIENPDAKTLRHTDVVSGREGHLALRVADYNEALDTLREAGIAVHTNRESITGWAQIFCNDPDGNVIELNAPRVD